MTNRIVPCRWSRAFATYFPQPWVRFNAACIGLASIACSQAMDQSFQPRIFPSCSRLCAPSRELLVAQYAQVWKNFTVLLWSGGANEIDRELKDRLQRLNIPVHLAENVLPDYDVDPSRYLIRSDWHPNALANRLLAEYVVAKISLQKAGVVDPEE